MANRLIYAPNLLASAHWYADVLDLLVEAVQAEPAALRLPSNDALVFLVHARLGAHVLPVAAV